MITYPSKQVAIQRAWLTAGATCGPTAAAVPGCAAWRCGAYLLGADLREADLRRADLLGADLRAADLRGADLGESLFLTQPQLDAASGDAATAIPPSLIRPPHWTNPGTLQYRRR